MIHAHTNPHSPLHVVRLVASSSLFLSLPRATRPGRSPAARGTSLAPRPSQVEAELARGGGGCRSPSSTHGNSWGEKEDSRGSGSVGGGGGEGAGGMLFHPVPYRVYRYGWERAMQNTRARSLAFFEEAMLVFVCKPVITLPQLNETAALTRRT